VSESFNVEPAPVVPNVTAVAPKKRNPFDLLLMGAAAVALAGVAFAGGRLTAPAAAATTGAGTGGTGVTGGTGGGGAGRFGPNASFRPDGSFQPGGGGGAGGLAGGSIALSGSVVAVSATEITLQLANGATVNIPIDSSTAYHSQASATSSDVKAGTKVQVEVSGGVVRGPGGPGGGGTAASPAPNASGTTRQLGTASSITIIP
jgi:hypothetical protein